LNHKHSFEVNKEIVGIEKKYEETELLPKIGSNEVRTLGLLGMDGIRKTTLAKDLYVKPRSHPQLNKPKVEFVSGVQKPEKSKLQR
jgi:hypothetical protein